MKSAIEALLKKGEKVMPSTIMAYLKSKAGLSGCAITRVGEDHRSVWWENSSNMEEVANISTLKSRLNYLKNTNPELFNTSHNKDKCQLSLKTDPSFASKIDPRCY